MWWAREELNLRPLPCQIPRTSAGPYGGWLETGKDDQKGAVEWRCERLGALTIRHGSPRVVLISTAVGCCPSAARRAKPDLDYNRRPFPSVLEPETGDLRFSKA